MNDQQDYGPLSGLNVTIVGLGLMGGSLAMALKGMVGKLIGVESNDESRRLALETGIVDLAAEQIENAIAEADLVVFAVPVQSIASLIRDLPHTQADGCMVLDLGSTKRDICLAMDALPDRFSAIGGHPMCGRERSGLTAAAANLYEGQTFVLCRTERTTPAIEQLALALVGQIGSRPLFLTADTHDDLVATSSHLPYVVSSILMGRAWARAAEDERLWPVSASGLRDTTRLAGSNPEMMLEIMLANRSPLLAQMEAFGDELAIMAEALRKQDREALRALLETASQQRAAYMGKKYG